MAKRVQYDPTLPLFHGTISDLEPGDIILPAKKVYLPRNFSWVHKGTKAFATDRLKSAQFFALCSGISPCYVYEVEPVNPEDVQVFDIQQQKGEPPVIEYRSKLGFRVKRLYWEDSEGYEG